MKLLVKRLSDYVGGKYLDESEEPVELFLSEDKQSLVLDFDGSRLIIPMAAVKGMLF